MVVEMDHEGRRLRAGMIKTPEKLRAMLWGKTDEELKVCRLGIINKARVWLRASPKEIIAWRDFALRAFGGNDKNGLFSAISVMVSEHARLISFHPDGRNGPGCLMSRSRPVNDICASFPCKKSGFAVER
jgi:hypothetical protein